METVRAILPPDRLFKDLHRAVYEAMQLIVERGQKISPFTLAPFFKGNKDMVADGGPLQWFGHLAGAGFREDDPVHLARQVIELADRRSLVVSLEEAIGRASDRAAGPVSEEIARATSGLRELAASIGTTKRGYAITVAADLAGAPVPERPWIVKNWIPRRQVTLLSGDGGVGKSLVCLQLMVAAATGTPWLGLEVERVPAFGLFAEDDETEMHARLVDVANAAGLSLADLVDVSWRSAVVDPCELVEVDDRGEIRPSPYFEWMRQTVLDRGARLVVLDAATNLYGGDELKRRQVNAFLVALRRLAIEIDGAVVLLAHPSVQGMHTNSGLSGSTHWNNGVRSRLYFTTEKAKDGEAVDPNVRVLDTKKANYSAGGGKLRVRWQAGAFVRVEDPSRVEMMVENNKIDARFLELLARLDAQGRHVGDKRGSSFAPAVMARMPDAGANSAGFEAAMERLLTAGKIAVVKRGPPSRSVNVITAVTQAAA